jgi:hypothetical protein
VWAERKEGTAVQLNEKSYGFAMGVGYALMMALYAWGLALFDRKGAASRLMAEFYPGFRPTLGGGFVSAVYGFLMGYPFGYLMARVYNESLKCPACQQSREQVSEREH